MKIPFLSFEFINNKIKKEILESFQNFFDSSWYILGKQVEKFEKQFASFNNVTYCIGVSNGLDALHIALKTLGIGNGDEIILPSNTYIATALAVSHTGATPIFVEPDIATYNINPDKIQAAINSKTKAILPVHLYGQACEMGKIISIAQNNNLFVIEDNAQSHGASFKEKMTGTWGIINATSFYPGKNLGAFGDGGAVTTNNINLADKARLLRNYGSGKKYHNEILGYNMRLDECQAGFLSIKLKYLKEWTEQRQEVAHWYNEELKNIDGLVLPKTAESATHVYHLYVIRVKRRNELQNHLAKNNIGTLIHYPIPIHLQEAYKFLGHQKGAFPIAEEIAETCLSLPIWPGMQKKMIVEIATIIKSFSK